MFTERAIYLSLDIFEILGIVNFNLAQSHNTNALFCMQYIRCCVILISHTIKYCNICVILFLYQALQCTKLANRFTINYFTILVMNYCWFFVFDLDSSTGNRDLYFWRHEERLFDKTDPKLDQNKTWVVCSASVWEHVRHDKPG